MKEFKFKDFVKFIPGNLDSIVGGDGTNDKGIPNYPVQSHITYLENLTGEKIWVVDKGKLDLIDFFTKKVKEKDIEMLFGEVVKVQFEEGVNFYCSRNGGDNVYMNVSQIILPPKNKIAFTDTSPRLYIIQGAEKREDGRVRESVFYQLPALHYPPLKEVIKWLRERGTLDNSGKYSYSVWNITVSLYKGQNKILNTFEIYTNSGYLMSNLKTEIDLIGYNEWLKMDYVGTIEDEYNRLVSESMQINPSLIKPINPTPVHITQEDVNQIIKEYNNRFKIVR